MVRVMARGGEAWGYSMGLGLVRVRATFKVIFFV